MNGGGAVHPAVAPDPPRHVDRPATAGGRPLFIVSGFIMAFSGFALLFGTFPTVLGLSHNTLRTISICCSAAPAP